MKKGKGRGGWVLFKFSFQRGRSLFKVGNFNQISMANVNFTQKKIKPATSSLGY